MQNLVKENETGQRMVLNVGGNNKTIAIPPVYNGWNHHLLDIDPRGKPDILCDARDLLSLPPGIYDAIYCSHNLEHFYRHDVPRVLAGFWHVLKDDGFVEVHVPDIGDVMRAALEQGLDVDDVLYQSPGGPITVQDVIYGWGKEIEDSHSDFYAHKTGFTRKSLVRILKENGFPYVVAGMGVPLEAAALGFKQAPNTFQRKLFGLPALPQAEAAG